MAGYVWTFRGDVAAGGGLGFNVWERGACPTGSHRVCGSSSMERSDELFG